MKPVIAMTLDGTYEGQYDYAFPYMAARKLLGTLYLNVLQTGTAGCMSVAEIQEMRSAGWEIGIRSYDGSTDFPAQGESATRLNWANAIAWCQANGLGTPKTCQAPSRLWDANVATWAADYWDSCRVVADTTNHIQPLPPADLRYVNNGTTSINSYTGAVTPAVIKGWVDELIAAGDNSMLILLWHKIYPTAVDAYTQTVAEFQEVVDYIVAKRAAGLLDVVPFDAALKLPLYSLPLIINGTQYSATLCPDPGPGLRTAPGVLIDGTYYPLGLAGTGPTIIRNGVELGKLEI